MLLRPVIVDTNIVVSGLITADPEAPTSRILDGMLRGRFPFLLSEQLLAEYRIVLLRPRIQRLHGLSEAEVDVILTEIAINGILRELVPLPEDAVGPDPGDRHLWELLATTKEAVLVTGDRLLREHPPALASVISPTRFVQQIERTK
jgi:predicted nucleic acid-binding protein